jgi:hypothetical protein
MKVLASASLIVLWAASGLAALPAHRIGIRPGNGSGEFYDRTTGETFIPRGANYIRLANQVVDASGAISYNHSTFDVGGYDAETAETVLTQMQAMGFNTVRVFLNVCCLDGLNDGQGGLSAPYLANFADFLVRAKSHNLLVIVTKLWLPQGVGWKPPDTPQFVSVNLRLTPAGVAAQVRFWTEFIQQVSALTPMDGVFGYEYQNEPYFYSDQPPLSLTSGTVTTANGGTYDMSDPADKQRMIEDGLIYEISQVHAAILAVDPTALVTAPFAVPSSQAATDKIMYPAAVLAASELDYNDVHPYVTTDPNQGTAVEEASFDQIMQQFGITAPPQGKPLMMSEFGETAIYDAATGARTLENWQVKSCSYGISGWLLWLWANLDPPAAATYWTAANPTIGGMLSPLNRPNACQPGEYPGRNIAFSASATASSSAAGNPPSLAVDGAFNTQWVSGGKAPQWLEIDLGAPSSIAGFRLTVSQNPAGATVHNLLGRAPGGAYQLLYTFTGNTTGGDVLTYTPPVPLTGIEFIRVETVQSPTTVAWHEIEVFSAGESPSHPERNRRRP